MHHVAASLLAGTLALSLALLPSLGRASPFAVPSFDAAPEVSEAEAEAKAQNRDGSDAYALGNYEKAVGHFERAYELSQEPALLFNLGQSYTRWYDISNDLEHLKKARRLYENYVLNVGLTELDETQQADARADAQRRIAEVDRRIAQHQDESGQSGQSGQDDTSDAKPIHKKAWFWVTIVGGLAVVGGVTAAVLLTTRRPGFEPELGTIGRAANPGGLTLRF